MIAVAVIVAALLAALALCAVLGGAAFNRKGEP